MSQIGFVYILTNDYMPDVYKVGCTERSPHERAAELSRSTGVPYPFEVLCYMEIADFQREEKRIHDWLASYRISAQREFFHIGVDCAVRYLFWHPERLTFCCPGRNGAVNLLSAIEFDGEFVDSLNATRNPFEKSTVVPLALPSHPFDLIGVDL